MDNFRFNSFILLVGVLAWVLINGAGIEKDPAAPIEVLNIEQN